MPTTGRQEFRVAGLHEPISHYTDAVRFGDLLFVSGIAPLDADLAGDRSSHRAPMGEPVGPGDRREGLALRAP